MKQLIELKAMDVHNKLPAVSASSFQNQHCIIRYTELKALEEYPWCKKSYGQMSIVLRGEFEMQIGDDAAVYEAGMMSYIPANEMHRVIALSDCKVITIMYPRQEMN